MPATDRGLLSAVLLFALIIAVSPASAQQIGKRASQIELTVSTIEGSTRTSATFSAQVRAADSTAASKPSGSVSFMNGGQSIGAAFVDSEGRATYTVEALPAGSQKITAVYVGDDAFEASTSAAAAVNSAASGVPGFTLSAGVTSLSVVAGGTATTVITATPENGFNQLVALSCSGIPYASVTCVFSPSQVTPGAATTAAPNGTPAISTLSIQTTAASGAKLRETTGSSETAYAVAVPGILALAGLGFARKRVFGKSSNAVKVSAVFLLLTACSFGLSSCAQRYKYFHKPPSGNPGTPVGTYTVIVSGSTGTGSSLSTSTVQFTLTVTAS